MIPAQVATFFFCLDNKALGGLALNDDRFREALIPSSIWNFVSKLIFQPSSSFEHGSSSTIKLRFLLDPTLELAFDLS